MKNILNKISGYFSNRKTRPIATLVALVPILIVIIVLGVKTYKGVKDLKNLNSDTVVEVKDDHNVPSMNYVLRDTATDYQQELFNELKSAVEEGQVTSEDTAKLVAENFVADFFTFSNKVSQYDVGGMYYVNKDSRENMYTYARDTIYKYLTDYINKYGADSLMTVKDITATVKQVDSYPVTTSTSYYVDDYNLEYEYTTTDYDCYQVELSWDYDSSESFSTSKWPKEALIKVIYNYTEARYEIVYVDTDFNKSDATNSTNVASDTTTDTATTTEVKSNG